MNLAIDIGNTFTKVGLFDGDELLEVKNQIDSLDLKSYLRRKKPEFTIICDVSNGKEIIFNEIAGESELIFLNPNTRIPIINKYQTPETLGMDRLAAVIGTRVIFPDSANLSIDLGTCITYDFINRKGEYLGGRISPGMQLRWKAMHNYTAKLPMVERPQQGKMEVGVDTVTSLRSGVVTGIVHEIEGTIREFQEKFGQINVILCGGDAKFFESIVKPTIFVNHNLTLLGLNKILKENVN
ncbi:MAG: type III pantothenate kinase [Flammeovirgaceae bacterium]|nr:type III pantothenate kinase [Flammeovirgaceae bacterium]